LPPRRKLGELGGMQNTLAAGFRGFIAAAAIATWGAALAGDVADIRPLVAAARRAGLRVLESKHLVLVTDRPDRAGDGVADLPRIFDEAFACWCDHYGIAAEAQRDWRGLGCLVVNPEAFRSAGLIDAKVPAFRDGFCAGNRFWLSDQSNPAFRRHLLLHEGVHAFTTTVRGLATPEWYTEGIAEYLATHRLAADAAGVPRFEQTPIPARTSDVEQLGRIESLRAAAAAGRTEPLARVFTAPVGNHEIAAYAASWAAVAFLSGHPAHAPHFAAAERGPLDERFTERLTSRPGWDAARVARDHAAFIAELDYGYDFERTVIDWSPGQPLTAARRVAVAADRGWLNTGCRAGAGTTCRFAATGRTEVGRLQADDGTPNVLESEADGISLRWYRGRPLGRLLVAQWIDDGAGFRVLATGAEGEFTAAVPGPLFVKINESPGELADNRGRLEVEFQPR
jgi:hypothetical protein